MPEILLQCHYPDAGQRRLLERRIQARHPAPYYSCPRLPSERQGACYRGTASDERGARWTLDKAAAAVRFMDRTHLRPSRAWSSLFGRGAPVLPRAFDHVLVWRDLADRPAVTIEPYPDAETAREIEAWCAARGWQCREAPGIHLWSPSTTLYLLAPPGGPDLRRLAERAMPAGPSS